MAGTDLREKDELSDELNPAELKAREQAAPAQEGAPADEQEPYDREFNSIAENYDKKTAEEPSLYKPENAGEGVAATPTKHPDRRSAIKNYVKKNKWKLVAGGAGAMAPLIILVLTQIGSLLLPNLSSHIDDRFKGLGRRFINSTEVIIAQKVAFDATGDQKFKEALDGYKDNSNDLLAKINRLRPGKVAEQLLLNMEFVYGEPKKLPGTDITRQRLIGIVIDGKTIDIPENSRGVLGKVTHPIDYVRASMKTGKSIREAIPKGGKLQSLMRTRSKAAKIVRAEVGAVRMYRWTKDQIEEAEKKPPGAKDALVGAIQESYKVATNDGAETRRAADGAVGDVKTAAEEAAAEQAQCMANPECVEQVAERGDGIAPQADAKVTDAFRPTKLKTAMATVGAGYEVAGILCLMYNSSLAASRAVMKTNYNESIRTYHSMAAAADAQAYTQLVGKDNRVQSSLTGGYVAQFGDISTSVPEDRANGGLGSTRDALGPQASAAGFYGTDIFSNFMSPSGAAVFANVAGPFCGVMSNVWTAGAVTIGELAVSVIPGVGQAIKASGTVTAKVTVKILAQQFGKVLKQSLSKRELAKFGATEAIADIAAYAGRAITLQRIGIGFAAAQVGPELANQADAGALLFSHSVDRQQNASIPMPTPTYQNVQQFDDAFQAAQLREQHHTVFDRYLALDNPNSLLTRAATMLHGKTNLRNIASSVQSLGSLFNPTQLLSATPFMQSRVAYAETDPIIGQEYGIIPWGWSQDEEDAYMHDPEYAPLYNQKQLDSSGQAGPLRAKYSDCFDSKISFADLIADGKIVRDDNANVIPDKGLCAPHNLGEKGPDGDHKLTFASPEAQLVFRLRVAIRNTNTIDELLEIQEPTETDQVNAGGNIAGSGIVDAAGYSWPVGDQKKHGYGDIPCAKPPCHHDNTGAADLMFGSAATMGGRPVYAISNGVVVKAAIYKDQPNCYSIQFLSDKDKNFYWYGHLQNVPKYKPEILNATSRNPVRVNAGEQMAEVAATERGPVCHGRAPDAQPAPHLHIDRGCTRNGVPQWGGRKSCRDPDFPKFLNNLWSRLEP